MPKALPILPWYQDGLSFTCTQCGNCCTGGPGYVWISKEEVVRLADHFKITPEQAVKKYCRTLSGKLSLKESRDEKGEYPCIFLQVDQTGKRGCSIYQVRPLQCRTWPFWDGNLDTKKHWEHAGKKCPGLNKGKSYSLEQIVALRDAQDWPDQNETPGSKK